MGRPSPTARRRATGSSPTRNRLTSIGVPWIGAIPRCDFILALKHESGGLLIASHDGGKTFSDIGKGYDPPGSSTAIRLSSPG